MPFTVELGVEKFRIIGPNGEEGPEVDFDNGVATLKIGNEIYYCDVEFDPTDTFALPEQLVECVTQSRAEKTTTVDVLFDGEQEDDREGPGDDDEGEEEDDAPSGPELVA